MRRIIMLIVPTLLVALAALPLDALAQSADQEVVGVVDSPDPVVPGNNVTYTVTVRNNGPDTAVNGGLNVNLDTPLSYVSSSAPAGFSCYVSGNNVSCLNPSWPAGATAVITIVAKVGEHLINYPDGTFTSNFFPSGTTPDPNGANNFKTATTTYDSPQIDISTVVTDSPDPVMSGQNITYSIDVTNAGPDSAGPTTFSVYNNNTLPFVSATAAPGFACTFPNVGSAAVFSCTKPTLAPGTYHFTVVLKVDVNVLGPFDSTVQTYFGANGTGNDTNPNNNGETEQTQYVTPDADMTVVSVTDTPDPVLIDGTLVYHVTVSNAGPDPATEARFNAYNNGSLQFISITGPPGFPCSTPVGNFQLQCAATSFPVNTPAEFVITVRPPRNAYGIHGGSTQTSFVASSNLTDPNNNNNTWLETTTVLSDDLFKDGFE